MPAKKVEMIEHSQRGRRGSWRWLPQGLRPVVDCPWCGVSVLLSSYHVNFEGMVTPDFECPRTDCDYLGPIRLDEWVGKAKR